MGMPSTCVSGRERSPLGVRPSVGRPDVAEAVEGVFA